jgi:hypothetical protein
MQSTHWATVVCSCAFTCSGSLRGNRVAVKLTVCGGERSLHGAALHSLSRVSRLRHPNLLDVYALRVAVVDEAALSELDPGPTLRHNWAAVRRPGGRLHRFLAALPHLDSPGAVNGRPWLGRWPGEEIIVSTF